MLIDMKHSKTKHESKYLILGDRMRTFAFLFALSGEFPEYCGIDASFSWHSWVIKGNQIFVADENDSGMIEELMRFGLICRVEDDEGKDCDFIIPEDPVARAKYEKYIAAKLTEPYWALIENDEDYLEILNLEKIRIPLEGHTSKSICNLVFMIYCRDWLLSKATGGDFYVSDALVEELQIGSAFRKLNETLDILKNADDNSLRGISFDEKSIIFDGFPAAQSQRQIDAWKLLAKAMSRCSIAQYHVHPHRIEGENEKFIMRNWFSRIKMNGREFKDARNELYKNLSGNTAIRDKKDNRSR